MRIRFREQVVGLAMLALSWGGLTATAGPISGATSVRSGGEFSTVDSATGLLRPLELAIERDSAASDADAAFATGDPWDELDAGFCRPGTGCVTCSEPAGDPGQLVVLAGLMFVVWRRTRQQPRR